MNDDEKQEQNCEVRVISTPLHNLRVVSINVLFEAFYAKYATTQTKYPAENRFNEGVRMFTQDEPFVSADVICVQEYDTKYTPVLFQAGFIVYLSHNSRGPSPSSAYVATLVRKETMTPAIDVISIPLETNGSKALLLTLLEHRASGRLILIGNAHVPWSSSSLDSLKYFQMMIRLMIDSNSNNNNNNNNNKPISSIFCGDFNTATSDFEKALDGDEALKILNAIPDVTFSCLNPRNQPLLIDHMWYYSPSSIMKRKDIEKGSPTMLYPSDNIDDLLRHTTCQEGKPDFKKYISDHAGVAADFELVGDGALPKKSELLHLASELEKKFLERNVASTKQVI